MKQEEILNFFKDKGFIFDIYENKNEKNFYYTNKDKKYIICIYENSLFIESETTKINIPIKDIFNIIFLNNNYYKIQIKNIYSFIVFYLE